jgi:hypothetical protein
MGSKIRMTREKTPLQSCEGYGDPLENILQKRAYWQAIYDQQMAKASRHWNIKKLAEAGKVLAI